MINNYKVLLNDNLSNIFIVLKSLFVGLIAGIVTVLYRLTLTYAEGFSLKMYAYLRSNLIYIPIAIIILCLVAYFLGHMVLKSPMIAGSGIPQLEGILTGYFGKRKGWLNTFMGKFVGGTLAIGAGLSLGREGPSIQLGACVAEGLGVKLGRDRLERKILMASGASAGLAAAFNAPMAGVMFALEEIFKYFSPVILLSMMSAAVAADFISKQVFGIEPIFNFQITQTIPLNSYWILILLGIFLGLLGALYNYALLKTIDLYAKIKCVDIKIKMMIPFLMAAVLGLFFPVVLGGGHTVIEDLTIENGIGLVLLIFVLKFIFSMVSFGSGAPGGIFFPLIVLGAAAGAIFAGLSVDFLGLDSNLFNNIIILAMAGYFTAIVRAPITGIVLILEMTGSFKHMLPLTVVAVTAYAVADLVKSPPIYEALLKNLLKNEEPDIDKESSKKVMVELIVKHGSKIGNLKVKEISWPSKSLLVGLGRGDICIIPKGNTVLKEGDFLTILTDINSECKTRELLEDMTGPN